MTNVSFCLLVLTYILSAFHFKSKKVFVAVDRDLVVTIESYESAEGGRLLNYFESELDSILKQGTASFANGFANFTFSSHHDHFSRLLGVNINRPDRERSDGRGIGYPIEQDGLQNLLSRKVYSQVTEQKLLSVKYSLIENEDHWTVIKSSQVSPAVDVFVCKNNRLPLVMYGSRVSRRFFGRLQLARRSGAFLQSRAREGCTFASEPQIE